MFPSDIELNYLNNIDMPGVYPVHYISPSMHSFNTAVFLLFYYHQNSNNCSYLRFSVVSSVLLLRSRDWILISMATREKSKLH